MATPDGRTCIRDTQNVDGINPLSDQDAAKSANGDEFARTGLQHEASNKHSRYANADAGNAGLKGLFASGLRRPRQNLRNRKIREKERSDYGVKNAFPHSLGRLPTQRVTTRFCLSCSREQDLQGFRCTAKTRHRPSSDDTRFTSSRTP